MADEEALITLNQANRAARKNKTAHRQAGAVCFRCGNQDPIHTHRFRRKSKGRDRPAYVLDSMMCGNCGAEWTEKTTFVKADADV